MIGLEGHEKVIRIINNFILLKSRLPEPKMLEPIGCHFINVS